MDSTALVYIAQGELQKAEDLLHKATQRRTAIGAPLPKKDAEHLLSTGVLAALQGQFDEGRSILVEKVPGEDPTHLRGNAYSSCGTYPTGQSLCRLSLH